MIPNNEFRWRVGILSCGFYVWRPCLCLGRIHLLHLAKTAASIPDHRSIGKDSPPSARVTDARSGSGIRAPDAPEGAFLTFSQRRALFESFPKKFNSAPKGGGVKLWSGKDSNLRRQSRQIYSLLHLTALVPDRNSSWRTGSNRRPAVYKTAALPAELLQQSS